MTTQIIKRGGRKRQKKWKQQQYQQNNWQDEQFRQDEQFQVGNWEDEYWYWSETDVSYFAKFYMMPFFSFCLTHEYVYTRPHTSRFVGDLLRCLRSNPTVDGIVRHMANLVQCMGQELLTEFRQMFGKQQSSSKNMYVMLVDGDGSQNKIQCLASWKQFELLEAKEKAELVKMNRRMLDSSPQSWWICCKSEHFGHTGTKARMCPAIHNTQPIGSLHQVLNLESDSWYELSRNMLESGNQLCSNFAKSVESLRLYMTLDPRKTVILYHTRGDALSLYFALCKSAIEMVIGIVQVEDLIRLAPQNTETLLSQIDQLVFQYGQPVEPQMTYVWCPQPMFDFPWNDQQSVGGDQSKANNDL